MTKRIIEISSSGCFIKFKNQQLVIEFSDRPAASVPVEDLSAVILDSPHTTITQVAMRELIRAGISLVCSDEKHQPIGMWLPLDGNSLQGERFAAQAKLSTPTKKQLWKQIVQAKIKVQSRVLNDVSGNDSGISQLITKVRSGDPSNIEAQAAKRYWPRFFEDTKFRRNRDAEDQNRYLNYGYAILRSLVARSIVATGLHPCLGLHHCNKYNAYALADDLMEPYRPYVDLLAWKCVKNFGENAEIGSNVKRELLNLVKFNIQLQGEEYTMQGAIQKTAQSLSKVIMTEQTKLLLPET